MGNSESQKTNEKSPAKDNAAEKENVNVKDTQEQDKKADAATSESKAKPSPKAKSVDNAELDALRAKLEEAEKQLEEQQAEALRSRADLENTRKRLERDVQNAHKFALEKFAQELLPVIDSLEMGLQAVKADGADLSKVREGTELTLKMFTDCVGKFGIEQVKAEGESFNPDLHQAMSIQEVADKAPNTVLAVMQQGYTLQGRLIRPAMVVVSKAVAGADDQKGKNVDEKA